MSSQELNKRLFFKAIDAFPENEEVVIVDATVAIISWSLGLLFCFLASLLPVELPILLGGLIPTFVAPIISMVVHSTLTTSRLLAKQKALKLCESFFPETSIYLSLYLMGFTTSHIRQLLGQSRLEIAEEEMQLSLSETEETLSLLSRGTAISTNNSRHACLTEPLQ